MNNKIIKSKWGWLGLLFPVVVITFALYFAWRGDFRCESREISPAFRAVSSKNRFEYDFSYLKRVDPSLVKYVETATISLPFSQAHTLSVAHSGVVFVSGRKSIVEIDAFGKVKRKFETLESPSAISAAEEGLLVVAYPTRITVIDLSTGHERVLRKFTLKSILTSVTVDSGVVFVADAGRLCVWRVSLPLGDDANCVGASVSTLPQIDSSKLGGDVGITSIDGVPKDNVIERFVVPSPYFDIAMGVDDSLWVANTGRHELDNFSLDGRFRSSWSAPSGGIEGFFGCCNPANFAIMPNGDFVTAEKGVVRIKIYGPDGVFKCVVAPPSSFADGAVVTDLAVTPDGDVLVVDSKSKGVRVFKVKP
jgi:hypothetical protein